MSDKLATFSGQYQRALGRHLKQGPRADLRRAKTLGALAASLGLKPLSLARIHEESLRSLKPPAAPTGDTLGVVRQAARFFAAAITPMEKTHRGAIEAGRRQARVVESLRRISQDLRHAKSKLEHEVTRRRVAEQSLVISRRDHLLLVKEATRRQRELRLLSHQILTVQEAERKRISRELHDEIGQVLAAINAELEKLTLGVAHDSRELKRDITRTQRLVARSVKIVHRFALELRPAVLDDLGLIPALRTYMDAFARQQGLRARLTAAAAVEKLDSSRRTILFRVAQEAITNVGRHAHATQIEVVIETVEGGVRMKIKDDGRSFDASRIAMSRSKRLGVLGMRERLEMVGGTFGIESSPGRGTTVIACVPLDARVAKRNGASR